MINGARQLPVQHLTIRVPWHDSGWQGTFCDAPCANTSCTVLPRIASARKDDYEDSRQGECLEHVPREELPPCVDEHGTIMAPFAISMMKNHPYASTSENSHGHFAPTPYTIHPYSAAAIPFSWMLRERTDGNKKKGISSRSDDLQLDYSTEREPNLGSPTSWVQEGHNQSVLLETFFSAIEPKNSLTFFYAKRTPLVDDPRRIIVGVGRVMNVGQLTEYRYAAGSCPSGKISGYLWERNVEHSIRPNGTDGFILPYQELCKIAEDDDSIDLSAFAAFAPDEYFDQYSYGSEHLSQDGAIASLLAVEHAIKAMRDVLDAPWDIYLKWIDRELNRLWMVRGAFPGLGAALHAFGLPHGNLLAWHLVGNDEIPQDPWPVLGAALKYPTNLPKHLQDGIGETLQQKWEKLPDDRRSLLQLLARFNLTNDQALRWYQQTVREEAGIETRDQDILNNPYRLYEDDRLQANPISFAVIDRGMFPPETIRETFPVPAPSRVNEAIDPRRVRAVMAQTLEDAAVEGHTLLPSAWLIQRVRNRAMKPECPLDADTLSMFEKSVLSPLVETTDLDKSTSAFQLDRFVGTSQLIRSAITKRRNGKENPGDFDWKGLVDQAINIDRPTANISDDDKRARLEKSVALKELFRSRISVLMGSAGTGKSTLLKALCHIQEILSGGVLLLAPTGKARVRLEQASNMLGKGQTVAQFLNGLQRYDGSTGRYYVNAKAPRSTAYKTVIIDECSMLTEEQLAALLDAVKGVQRLVLVGDPKQLPPIGAGRPYVDIVEVMRPDNVDSIFPRVSNGYAELTVTMRQRDKGNTPRIDVLLAELFSGRALDAGADEVWHAVASHCTPYVKLVRWNQPGQLQKLLLKELVSELPLSSIDDELGFEVSIGGNTSDHNGKTNVFFNTKSQKYAGAAEKSEDWQILSPVRQCQTGVLALNRTIQRQFRNHFLDMAANPKYQRKIPAPAGTEEIIYGDKVINVINSSRRRVYPDKDDSYVANGDIGVVTGCRKIGSRYFNPKQLEVELASQPSYAYKYWLSEFSGQESTPPTRTGLRSNHPQNTR